jgi:hypothetical protein
VSSCVIFLSVELHENKVFEACQNPKILQNESGPAVQMPSEEYESGCDATSKHGADLQRVYRNRTRAGASRL